MLGGMLVVAMCDVSMVRGFFMIARIVVLGRFPVMVSRMFVMFRGLLVMASCFL